MIMQHENVIHHIKCPYCFREFRHDEVHFKTDSAASGSAKEQVFYFGQNINNRPSLESINRTPNECFTERDDEKYLKFWKQYRNDPGTQWRNWRDPVIQPRDTNMYTGSYHKDVNGFVDSVTDINGHTTYMRICPHCHNLLPQNYGRFPTYFFSIVGITNSGKTVYISQLLSHIDEYMASVGMASIEMNERVQFFLQNNTIKRYGKLPAPTTRGSLSEPLFYDFIRGEEHFTVVFYDIAGENCVDTDAMQRFGPFIRNANAILMIVDPDQFNELSENDDETYKPKKVVETMFNAFLASENKHRSSVPIAICFSKSDKLSHFDAFSQNSPIFHGLSYTAERKGYNLDEGEQVDQDIRQFLNQSRNGHAFYADLLPGLFERFHFFAFSALGGGVTSSLDLDEDQNQIWVSVPQNEPKPRRIEEPYFWLLYCLGLVDGFSGGESDSERTSEGVRKNLRRLFKRQ